MKSMSAKQMAGRVAGMIRRSVCRGRLGSDRRGSAVTVFALCLVPVTLAVGGAVDYSNYYDTRVSLQAALDASVLAGAARNSADQAANTFNAWKVKVDGATASATVTNYSGCSSASATCTGSYKTQIKTYFAAIVGLSTLPVTVTATAEKVAASAVTGGKCLWLVSSGSGLNMNGSGTISAPGCDIEVAATASGSTTLNSGAKIITPKLCIAAGSINNNGGSVKDGSGGTSLSYPCAVSTDPYASSLPIPSSASCDYPNNITKDAQDTQPVIMSPGVYCGGVTFNSTVKNVIFSPGLYVIRGGSFIFGPNVTVSGSGVTFFYADNSYLQFNSGATSTLSAPTSGTYSGILMYETPGLSTSYLSNLDTGTSHNWTGLIHLPSRVMQENAAALVTISGTAVFAAMTVNSGSSWTVAGGSTSGAATSVVRLKS